MRETRRHGILFLALFISQCLLVHAQLQVFSDGIEVSQGAVITDGGINVSEGDISVEDGDIIVKAGTITMDSSNPGDGPIVLKTQPSPDLYSLTIPTGGIHIQDGGLVVDGTVDSFFQGKLIVNGETDLSTLTANAISTIAFNTTNGEVTNNLLVGNDIFVNGAMFITGLLNGIDIVGFNSSMYSQLASLSALIQANDDDIGQIQTTLADTLTSTQIDSRIAAAVQPLAGILTSITTLEVGVSDLSGKIDDEVYALNTKIDLVNQTIWAAMETMKQDILNSIHAECLISGQSTAANCPILSTEEPTTGPFGDLSPAYLSAMIIGAIAVLAIVIFVVWYKYAHKENKIEPHPNPLGLSEWANTKAEPINGPIAF